MAYQVEKDPTLHKSNKTPAPVKPAEVVNPVARTFGRENLGANAYAGKVYTNPGERANNGPLSEEIARIQQIDGAMSQGTGLQQLHGLDTEGASQTRSISPSGYPVAHGMKAAGKSGETVPGKIGGTK